MYSIRHCEKKDIEQIRQIYAEPGNYSATLQSPFPSFELWETRLSRRESGSHDLVAVKGEEVLGHPGLYGANNPRRKHTANIGMAVKTAAHRQWAVH